MISYCVEWENGLFESADPREVARVRDERKAEGYEVKVGVSIDNED